MFDKIVLSLSSKLIIMIQEFKNIEECKDYLRTVKLKKAIFYFNVFGWSTYYTLERTFATPTGKLKGFPHSVVISTAMLRPKVI